MAGLRGEREHETVKIAIIGAGNVGKALGASLVRAGHDLTYATRHIEESRTAADAVGGEAAATAVEAAGWADAVILAVPWSGAEGVARAIAPAVAGKLVVDATNPLTADYSALATEGGKAGAERIAALVPGARVAKAFNTVFAGLQGDPAAHGVVLDLLYATDDEIAVREMADLGASLGFRPVHVGPLARASELEAMAFLNIQMQMRQGGDWRTAFLLVGPPPAATAVGRPEA